MSNQAFGNKCRCGHLERQHESIKAILDMPDNLIDIDNLQPHIMDMSISYETNCKKCRCKIFHIQ